MYDFQHALLRNRGFELTATLSWCAVLEALYPILSKDEVSEDESTRGLVRTGFRFAFQHIRSAFPTLSCLSLTLKQTST